MRVYTGGGDGVGGKYTGSGDGVGGEYTGVGDSPLEEGLE